MLVRIIKMKGQIFLSLEEEKKNKKKNTKLLWISYLKIVTEKNKTKMTDLLVINVVKNVLPEKDC